MRRLIAITAMACLCGTILAMPANAKTDDELFAEFRKDSFPATDAILGMPVSRRDKFLRRCLEEEHPEDLRIACLYVIEQKKLKNFVPLLEKVHRAGKTADNGIFQTLKTLDTGGEVVRRVMLDDLAGNEHDKRLNAVANYFQLFPATATAAILPILDIPVKTPDDEHLASLALLCVIESGHAQYCGKLGRFENSKDKRVRLTYLEVLGYCGTEKDVPGLEAIYTKRLYGASRAFIASSRITLRTKNNPADRIAYLLEIARERGGYTTRTQLALVELRKDILAGNADALSAVRSLAADKTTVGEVAQRELAYLAKEHGIK